MEERWQAAVQREAALQQALAAAEQACASSLPNQDMLAALEDAGRREENLKKEMGLLADVENRRIHVSYEVQHAKLRAELKVLGHTDELNRELSGRVKLLEAELAEARVQLSGTVPSENMGLRSMPDLSQLYQQAELQNERKEATDARQMEIDSMKARLEQENARAQVEAAHQQRADIEDLER